MVNPVEYLATEAWKLGNKAAWTGLRLTRMDGVIANLLDSVIPQRYESLWADAQEKAKRQAEEQRVLYLGKVTAQAWRGEISIDHHDLDPAWREVKKGQAGVAFEDVFDPHTAILLHNITPQPEVETQSNT